MQNFNQFMQDNLLQGYKLQKKKKWKKGKRKKKKNSLQELGTSQETCFFHLYGGGAGMK